MSDAIILKRFKELGVTAYEAKCYLSLLEKDTLTVSEISRIAGIPRANAYEELEKLLAKGLCISKPGRTKKYSASDPDFLREKISVDIAGTLKAELNNLAIRKDKIMIKIKTAQENLNALIDKLVPLYENSRFNENPLEYIEIIKDPFQAHKRVMQLFEEAEKEILFFTKPPYTGPRDKLQEQIEQEAQIMKKLSRPNWKSIYELPQDEEEKKWMFELIDLAVKAGEKARVIDELPMKMIIFDSRIVVYALEEQISKQVSLTTQVIGHRALAKSLKIIFEALWEKAKAYEPLL